MSIVKTVKLCLNSVGPQIGKLVPDELRQSNLSIFLKRRVYRVLNLFKDCKYNLGK